MMIVTGEYITEKMWESQLKRQEILRMPYFGIYHETDWDGGFDNDEQNAEEIDRFYSDMKDIGAFLKDFTTEMGVSDCIISKNHRYRWFEDWNKNALKKIDIYIWIKDFLSENGIRNNSSKGIAIDINDDWQVVMKIIEGGFRYISCGSFFFPQIGLVIEPTHNFELLFFTKDICRIRTVVDNIILSKYNKLHLYERDKWDWTL